jgi:hypothetical protein
MTPAPEERPQAQGDWPDGIIRAEETPLPGKAGVTAIVGVEETAPPSGLRSRRFDVTAILMTILAVLIVASGVWFEIVSRRPESLRRASQMWSRGPFPRDDWDLEELLEQLKGKGIVKRAAPSNSTGNPSMYFFLEDPAQKDDTSLRIQGDMLDRGMANMYSIHVELCPTVYDAKDRLWELKVPAFSWARFVFTGRPELLARVKAILPE